MKKLAKALVIARIQKNEKAAKNVHWRIKKGPWDKKVKKAGGGGVDIPSFDQTQPLDNGPPPFEATQSATSDEGMLHALGHGALQGATFNFGDELAGLDAASPKYVPQTVGPIPTGPIAGAIRLGLNDPE